MSGMIFKLKEYLCFENIDVAECTFCSNFGNIAIVFRGGMIQKDDISVKDFLKICR